MTLFNSKLTDKLFNSRRGLVWIICMIELHTLGREGKDCLAKKKI